MTMTSIDTSTPAVRPDSGTPRPGPLVVLHVMACAGGGAPVMAVNHLRALPHVTHHVLWPADNDPLAADLAGASNITWHRLDMSGPLTQLMQVHRLVRRLHPDLVWAHSSVAGVLTRVLDPGVPVVYEPHGWAINYPHWSALKRAVVRCAERLLARRTAATAVLTRADEATAEGLGLHDVVVVPSVSRAAATHDPVSRAAATHDPASRAAAVLPLASVPPVPVPPVVVMAGRITAVKDPRFFADVARLVEARTHGAVRFVWVGGGDEDLQTDLLAAGVEVTGWVTEAEVWDRVSSAGVYLHTSGCEGFPVTVVDAAHLGVPLVLRDIAAFADLPGHRFRSAEEAAEAICDFLSGTDTSPCLVSAAVRAANTADLHAAALDRLLALAAPGPVQRAAPMSSAGSQADTATAA